MWMGCLLLGVMLNGGASGGIDLHVLGALGAILVCAKLGGDLFDRLGQPAVLGELIAGIVIGNLAPFGYGLDWVAQDPNFVLLAEIGVILLLFEVGLESDLVEMARVGGSAFLVAIAGVLAPVTLGYLSHWAINPDGTWHTHLFIGAVLAATSVGITARVLQELGKVDSATGRVVLGAAVIDDVLGLVVLAVVAGIVTGANTGEALSAMAIVLIIVKASAFLGGAMLLGRPFARVMYQFATQLKSRHVLLPVSLAFCFALSAGAAAVSLAPIVGAFAAGIVLDAVVYRDLETRETYGLEVQLHPLTDFLVPVFFVVTGAKVKLGAMADSSIILLALALTVAAIIGKQVCSLFAFGPGVNKLAVGLGMIPRGEVGLIFADVGAKLELHGKAVIDEPTYAAVVVMVMVTTMVTPPILAWALARDESDDGSKSEPGGPEPATE